MRLRHWRHGGLLAVVLAMLAGPTAGWGQPAKSGTLADRLARLRVGHWVQLEGTVRGTGPVVCSEVRPLAGDFLDDDYALKGAVKSVDAAKREFSIGARRVRVAANTIYDNPQGTFRGIQDMRPGMVMDVEGTLLHDGTLLAAEVDDETSEIAQDPKLRDEVEVTGKIEKIDARKHLVTVMGIEFQISARTKMLSAIH